MNRRSAEARGRRGEVLAAWYLRCKGWRVLARRVKTPRGEIDLVVRRGRVVACIEVKWRASGAELALALDHYRLRRVGAAAEAVAARYLRPGDDLRVDAILLAPGRWPRHIANALLA
ncbi:MAG TPA: YraN family protein [Novosphingobium sp.]